MISWIAAWHDKQILDQNLGATLKLMGDDELILIDDAESITMAYAKGQAGASQPVKCYIHSDVRIFDLPQLRQQLIGATQEHGLVGVIGSTQACVPWWNGPGVGSVVDSRLGTLNLGPGGECAVVDGLLLATRQYINWDISWPGWHGYDMDACAQMRAREQTIWCLTNGHQMVGHYADSPSALSDIKGWPEAVARYEEKWT